MAARHLIAFAAALLAGGCGGQGESGNALSANEATAAGGDGALPTSAEEGDSAYGWVYAASGERGGPEALYGVVQGESFLAITCDRGRRVLRVTALGLPERVGGDRDAIRAGGVRGEFPVRWAPVEYGGEAAWDRVSEIPLDHPLAAALARYQGPLVFEVTATGEPAEIPTDAAVRRVAAECGG